MTRPHFTIKNRFQKRLELYEEILTPDILRDVCRRITGRTDFTVTFENDGYNKGRLATLEYQDSINYISFSEIQVGGRNSFFQSFPTALVKYHQETNPDKEIYFYFLPPDGNIEAAYFIFMYRLMKTAGTLFLNETNHLADVITPFNSVADVIAQRELNRGRNRGNASTYLTIDENNTLQIFGKTYGANKYETTLLCLAIHEITPYEMELYEIQERNLRRIPEDARAVITSLGIAVITSDLILERKEFESNDSLRSPTYNYNLLEKLGDKKCVLCNCEIPQIIQAAHIWSVASIKRANNINLEDKLKFAIDGDNGIWLCNNHHKLFDVNLIFISEEGQVKYKSDIEVNHKSYLYDTTIKYGIEEEILTSNFLWYLEKRNNSLDERGYSLFE